jgi:hypothetical protein
MPTTRHSNNGPLDDTTAVPNASSKETGQRVSNDLPLDDGPRKSNSAPEKDTVTGITDDGPMTTQ